MGKSSAIMRRPPARHAVARHSARSRNVHGLHVYDRTSRHQPSQRVLDWRQEGTRVPARPATWSVSDPPYLAGIFQYLANMRPLQSPPGERTLGAS